MHLRGLPPLLDEMDRSAQAKGLGMATEGDSDVIEFEF